LGAARSANSSRPYEPRGIACAQCRPKSGSFRAFAASSSTFLRSVSDTSGSALPSLPLTLRYFFSRGFASAPPMRTRERTNGTRAELKRLITGGKKTELWHDSRVQKTSLSPFSASDLHLEADGRVQREPA